MNKLITVLLLALCLPLFAAEVYKSVDQNGNTVFSDQPSENSEKIEVRDVLTIPALTETPQSTKIEPAEPYSSLVITLPINDETYFRREGNFVISVQSEPKLYKSDTVVIYLNSNAFMSGQSLTFKIPELDRGTYQLRVAIKDAADKIIKSSETVTFHMR